MYVRDTIDICFDVKHLKVDFLYHQFPLFIDEYMII
jgi:hypothetical protein